jgi:predicted SAM-dependent methyltransferase
MSSPFFERKQMKLNLGCGFRPMAGYTNIDKSTRCPADMHFDVSDGLPFEDGSIEEVRAYDFLEHIPIGKTIYVIEEIWRVLVPGGLLAHMTPSTDGRGAFQDPTHLSFWNLNSWLYYCDDAYRELYGIKAKFSIEELRDVYTGMSVVHTLGRLHAVK